MFSTSFVPVHRNSNLQMAEPQVGPENQAISAELQEIIEGTGIMQPNVNQNNQANKVNPSLGSEDKQELKENKPEVKDENKFEGTGSKPNAENGTVPNVVKPKRTKCLFVRTSSVCSSVRDRYCTGRSHTVLWETAACGFDNPARRQLVSQRGKGCFASVCIL